MEWVCGRVYALTALCPCCRLIAHIFSGGSSCVRPHLQAKLGGKGMVSDVIWAPEGVLATCSSENIIRYRSNFGGTCRWMCVDVYIWYGQSSLHLYENMVVSHCVSFEFEKLLT